MIIFKNVTKIYPADVLALDNISFEIKSGEFVLIIGRSGAGKTTILRILRREEEPTKGVVYYKNRNLLEIPRKRLAEIRRKIGIVYQDFKLLGKRTVFENIALALEIVGKKSSEIKSEVLKVAEKLKIRKKLDQLVDTLSGGEKQKVCLARCLVNKPEVLLADEPTGNLDPITSFELIEILKKINKEEGITVILATHNREIAESLKTRVITLNSGRIVSDQNPGSFTLI